MIRSGNKKTPVHRGYDGLMKKITTISAGHPSFRRPPGDLRIVAQVPAASDTDFEFAGPGTGELMKIRPVLPAIFHDPDQAGA